MRPSVNVEECEVYECPECGARSEDPDGRRCEDCGVVLTCLNNSRDL